MGMEPEVAMGCHSDPLQGGERDGGAAPSAVTHSVSLGTGHRRSRSAGEPNLRPRTGRLLLCTSLI